MSNSEFYLVEKKPPVAWVYLNRPGKKNAMNTSAWTESPGIFASLDQDQDIRVIIIAGKGPCFSVGIDLKDMTANIPEVMEKQQMGGIKWKLLEKIYQLQGAISCIEECRKPVIAAIHGYCLGAGLDMITACDFRLCSADAVFSLKETAIGFVADVGVLQRLPLIVGQGIARELAFTARDISAKQAKEIHLVNHVYKNSDELLKSTEKIALQIAHHSPLAVQASKDVLNYGVGKSIHDGLKYVAAISANIIPSHDFMEAITAFFEKRKPHFTGE
ncbi:MAG: crotonase/enoyl-CoA hydratase family protein [Candidatus Aminicenantes bacterium]|nr:MAG: crotonase/enoyl-CoA hydratase family protein [Candidatus Aminicenantes bacterium]